MWMLTPALDDSTDAAAEQEAALRQLGVSQAALDEQRRERDESDPSGDLVVWAWHLDAMQLFDAMRTQWRCVSGIAGLVWTGLDYAALPAVKADLGFAAADRALFQQLRTMETAALKYLNRTP